VTEELEDYREDEQTEQKVAVEADQKKGSYAAIHTSGFRDFLLRAELLQAVADAGFEHPSEVQHECIPQAMSGTDMISQAKSGMGKTAVFVIATLQQIDPQPGVVDTLVLGHTRELVYQICKEFQRFSKFLPDVKTAVFYGGVNIAENRRVLKEEQPNIVVGTPGRILALCEEPNMLKVDKLKRFIIDECDKVLDAIDMRKQVQSIFKLTPKEKQVLMFSATISKDTRTVCRRFAQHPIEVFIDDESKLTLHGLQQYYIKLAESAKNRKLTELLDALDFNQVIIFVKSVKRCVELNKLLVASKFPSMAIHSGLTQEERIDGYNKFKEAKGRILVSTDVWARGVDVERVNIVINYDMPDSSDTYLHRVNRAGRFGTKGLAVSFVSTEEDSKILEDVQSRFEVEITEMPSCIDSSTYMTA